jgi:hypothetical protein
MKNFISMVQSGIAPSDIAAGFVTVGGQKIELDPTKHDHPLMKDFIRQVLEPDKAFYE